MKAWHIDSQNQIKLEEDILQRKEGEVKLKLSKIALSSTDVCYFANDEHEISIPAHSAVAYVSEADDDSGLRLGARVVVSPFVKTKDHGVEVVRTMGVDIDGLMRDFVCVPQENVFVLPDGIEDESAVFTEYIATGIKVYSALTADKGDYVVIVGASTLGLVLGQLAIYYQMVPILIDMDGDKLSYAQKCGICYTLNPTYDDLQRKVEEITGGRMSEAAIFAGEGVSLNAALRLVKNEGEVIITGFSSRGKHQVDTDIILRKQLKVTGVCNGYGEMPSAINLLANKIIQLDSIISTERDFDEFPQVYEDCLKYPYQYNKILLTID